MGHVNTFGLIVIFNHTNHYTTTITPIIKLLLLFFVRLYIVILAQSLVFRVNLVGCRYGIYDIYQITKRFLLVKIFLILMINKYLSFIIIQYCKNDFILSRLSLYVNVFI